MARSETNDPVLAEAPALRGYEGARYAGGGLRDPGKMWRAGRDGIAFRPVVSIVSYRERWVKGVPCVNCPTLMRLPSVSLSHAAFTAPKLVMPSCLVAWGGGS